MLSRESFTRVVLDKLSRYPVVAILGARQVGKTTLAHLVAERHDDQVTRFDLDSPEDLSRLGDPSLALRPLEGLVILDEIQQLPDLFPLLKVLADRPERPARFLVLGSASPELLRQGSETLAGRISFVELGGFLLAEVGRQNMDRVWSRGGFPRSYLADSDAASDEWRTDFIRTFLERDLAALGFQFSASMMRRFWTMVAHSHGQPWNGARIAGALGVSKPTIRSWLDTLTDTYMIRQLQPHLANIGKRQVKSPKVYLRDCGLLHTLLGLTDLNAVTGHPICGASWEGFAIEQVIHHLGVDDRRLGFWGTHTGAELDLVLDHDGQLRGFEFKRTLAPKVTRSMRSAIESLDLASLAVVYPGAERYPLAEKIEAMPLAEFAGPNDG